MSLSNTNMEEYYQKVIQLQERLRQSEEERLKLEMKFNEMLQVMKEEEEAHFKKLRTKYKQFLGEDRRRQQRNDKILEALDRIENRAVMWEAKTEKFKAFRKKYRNCLKKACNEQRNRSPLDDERAYTDLKYDNHGFTDEKYDYLKGDKKEDSDDGENGIVEKYLQSLSSTKCKEDILQRKKNLPENTYSNLGNINSIYTRTPTNTEKRDTEKVEKFDNDFTQLKTTKDKENALKQNYNKNDDDISFAISKNDYSHLDSKKKPDDLYDDYNILQKASTISDNKTLINDDYRYLDRKPSVTEDYSKTYQKPNDEKIREIESKNQVQESPRQVHNELEKLLKEHRGSTSNLPNEITQKPISTYSPLHSQPKQPKSVVQEQLHSIPKEAPLIFNKGNHYVTSKPSENQLMQPKEVANQDVVENNSYYNTESSSKKSEAFDDILQRRPSKMFNLNEQQNLVTENQESMNMKDCSNAQQKSVLKRCPSEIVNQAKDVGKPLETRVEENEESIVEEKLPVSEISNNIQSSIPSQQTISKENVQVQDELQFEEKPLQEDNVNQGQPEETVTQYHEDTGQYLQQYYEHVQPLPQYDENGQLLQQYDENGQPLQQYDENGQLLQQYDENGQPIQLYEESGQQMQNYEQSGQPYDNQQYDENGQPLQQYYADNEQLPSQYYDENGQLIQQYYENSEHHMQGYDENGQPIIQYDQNGQPMMQYDENGQPLPQYNENGEPLNQYYDENGQPVQYYAESSHQMYDENGQPIQEQYNSESYVNQQQYYEQHGMEEEQQLQQDIGQTEMEQNSEQMEREEQAKSNVLDILETDTESVKQDTKISNDSDFDLSNA